MQGDNSNRAFSLRMHMIIFLLIFSQCSSSPSTAEREAVIALQPLGTVNKKIIETVTGEIERVYRARVIVLPARKLPKRSYYPPRRRYRADVLLDYLREIGGDRYDKIIGLTTKDISATKGKHYDWGIFGYGSLGGKPCVVSTYRLRRGASWKLFRNRLAKVVIHELGHTFGLDHCPTPGCVMEDGRGTVKTVDRGTCEFCPICRERIREFLRQVAHGK